MVFIYKLLLFGLMLFTFYGSTKSSTATSGPFRSYVYAVRNCSKPTYPYHPNPSITMDIELYNHTTLGPSLRGSFIVRNYTTGVKIKTKSMIWENGKWKTNFIVLDYNCRGSLMPLFMSLFNIRFNRDKCAFLESRMPFDISNTNKIHHLITNTAEYGRVVFVNEMFMMGKQFKTFYCFEYECIIEPI